jgi:hypothetical protein
MDDKGQLQTTFEQGRDTFDDVRKLKILLTVSLVDHLKVHPSTSTVRSRILQPSSPPLRKLTSCLTTACVFKLFPR